MIKLDKRDRVFLGWILVCIIALTSQLALPKYNLGIIEAILWLLLMLMDWRVSLESGRRE